MRTYRVLWLGALLGALLSAPQAWAIDQNAVSLQIVKTFRNVSGGAITSGSAVVFLFTDSRTTTGGTAGAASTIGMDVTTTTVVSNRQFVGVTVDDSCADGRLCNVAVFGPVLARFACGSNNTYGSNGSGDRVGTSSIAGQLGSGIRAGWILSNPVAGPQAASGAGTNSDNCLRWVFVYPEPSGS